MVPEPLIIINKTTIISYLDSSSYLDEKILMAALIKMYMILEVW